MYTLRFASGEHETFGCLACSRSFVSKRALQRHFDRNPSHEGITITGTDIEGADHRDGSEELSERVER